MKYILFCLIFVLNLFVSFNQIELHHNKTKQQIQQSYLPAINVVTISHAKKENGQSLDFQILLKHLLTSTGLSYLQLALNSRPAALSVLINHSFYASLTNRGPPIYS